MLLEQWPGVAGTGPNGTKYLAAPGAGVNRNERPPFGTQATRGAMGRRVTYSQLCGALTKPLKNSFFVPFSGTHNWTVLRVVSYIARPRAQGASQSKQKKGSEIQGGCTVTDGSSAVTGARWAAADGRWTVVSGAP